MPMRLVTSTEKCLITADEASLAASLKPNDQPIIIGLAPAVPVLPHSALLLWRMG